MRKQILALVMVLVMLMGVAAQATGPMKAPAAMPSLAFNGSSGVFSVTVSSIKSTDPISVTAKLWRGTRCLNTWTASGSGRVKMEKNFAAIKGNTYKVTVDYTINGVKQPQKSTTGICN